MAPLRPRRRPPPAVDQPWARPWEEVARELGADPAAGLAPAEARRRLGVHGRNRLRAVARRSAWSVLASQFKSLIVLLLLLAAGVSFAFGEWVDAIAIAAVIAVNAAIGFFTELSAVRSVESLRLMGRVASRVLRGGALREVPAEELVPGDLVVLEGGDLVTADLRLVEASRLQADESTLTGESLPVDKGAGPTAADAPLSERTGMLYKGTAVTRGAGRAVVVATGMATELGQISSLVEEAEEEVTPLEKRLDRLGQKLLWISLVLAGAVAASGLATGRDPLLMIETAIALAVAAIPEGLPIVATIALARGVWRMARRNALVNRLSAVETLGATSVICTDKTGTLTENRMAADRYVTAGGEARVTPGRPPDPMLREALEVGALCNNAQLPPDGPAVGDPTEVALLVAAAAAGLGREDLLRTHPEVREEAFDSETQRMATVHRDGDGFRFAIKGAPEAVLPGCREVLTADGPRGLDPAGRERWDRELDRLAGEGLRVLALASKRGPSADAPVYEGLVLVGLVGLADPPRPEVPAAVRACRQAGIRVVMITGDQPRTALTIARAVGLVDDGDVAPALLGRDVLPPGELDAVGRERLLAGAVFARVSPRQKLDLIALHQGAGAVVAMTGDGVNDAPALKKADIGVAMGQRGTQVAREAADMVLKDDAFGTIVAAVGEGRVIFQNIRKFCVYLLSCNVSEVLAVSAASLVGAPLPLLPLQILFLNLVTDVFPALALGVGEGDPSLMGQPPRPSTEPVLPRRLWLGVGAYGVVIAAAVLGALAVALGPLGLGEPQAVTVSFLTLAVAQLLHVFNLRSPGSGLVRNDITRNPFVWGALALCAALLAAAVYLPGLAEVLQTVDPGPRGWLVVLGASLVPLAVGQVALALGGRR
ncbi:MAG: cation-translocating P-type ATPase [Deferrisomatales bacterium]